MNTSKPIFWQDARDSNTFRYIPGTPTPETAPNGRPTLTLWVTDNDARLQLGARWDLTPAERTRAVQQLATQYAGRPAGQLNLQPTQIQVSAVLLLIGEGRGTWTTLATSTSSGFVPFNTVFAVSLSVEQKAHALSALHGRRGFLAVRYVATAQDEKGAWIPQEQTADLADWFSAGRGSDHIHVMPTARLTPTADARGLDEITVILDESLKTAPLAFIALEQGKQATVLRPPVFAPVIVPTNEFPQRCTTHYTVGNPPYAQPLETPKDNTLTLTAPLLGLVEIVVTAPTYHTANARELRATVRYTPSAGGTLDTHTVLLKGDAWEERWWVVSRAPTLAGSLEVIATITHADGRTEMLPPRRYTDGHISIGP